MFQANTKWTSVARRIVSPATWDFPTARARRTACRRGRDGRDPQTSSSARRAAMFTTESAERSRFSILIRNCVWTTQSLNSANQSSCCNIWIQPITVLVIFDCNITTFAAEIHCWQCSPFVTIFLQTQTHAGHTRKASRISKTTVGVRYHDNVIL